VPKVESMGRIQELFKGGPNEWFWDRSPPVGSRGKVPVGSLGTKSPEVETKCYITV